MKRKLIAVLMAMTLVLSCGMVAVADEPSEEGTEMSQVGDGGGEGEEQEEKEEEKETVVPEASADTSMDENVISEDHLKELQENAAEKQNPTADGENATEEEIPIDETHFPDATFRDIVSNCDKDGNGRLSQSERDSVISIGGVVSDNGLSWNSKIQDMTGIEYFSNLKKLLIFNSQLKKLDISKNVNLEELSCYGNQLTSLDVSNNLKLKSLSCPGNPLGKLDLSKNVNLETLSCAGSNLSNLDISKNLKLKWLSCGGNQLTILDVSNNRNLETLACPGNQLTNINVGNNENLKVFNCRTNQLINLDISNNLKLERFDCSFNQLPSLDVSKNAELLTLWCDNNQLRELNITQNLKLVSLKCYKNCLLELDLSKNIDMLVSEEGVDGVVDGFDIMHTDLGGSYVTPQSTTKMISFINGKWSFDLATIIGKDNIGRVSLVTEGAELSDSGVVTFSGDKVPSALEYTYDTQNPAEATPMAVQVALGSINDQTKESVRFDTSELDLDRICKEHNVDPGKAEIVLSQETPDQKDTEKLIPKAGANEYSFVNAYEVLISLYSDGNKIADITENFGKVTLTLQAGKNYAGYHAVVYQLHNGEEIIPHEGLTVDAEGMVTITVDKFSTFAVSVRNKSSVNNSGQSTGNNQTLTNTPNNQTATNTPNNSTPTFSRAGTNTSNAGSVKTGDPLDVVLWSILCMISVGACMLLVRKKYYKHS